MVVKYIVHMLVSAGLKAYRFSVVSVDLHISFNFQEKQLPERHFIVVNAHSQCRVGSNVFSWQMRPFQTIFNNLLSFDRDTIT